jgi:hypothetical protein
MPVFDLEDELGFWVVTMLLGLVLAYNVWELVALQRLSNRGSSPLSSADSAEPGWPQGPPPQGPR